MKTKKQVVEVKGRQGGFDQQKMIELAGQGKSINEIAAAVGASPIWTRRVLSTKAPAVYKANIEARHTTTSTGAGVVHVMQPVAKAGGRRLLVPGTKGNGEITAKQAVEIIARSVAAAAFGDAKFVPQPQTRTEMFDSIQKGVAAGVKKLGFGFHA